MMNVLSFTMRCRVLGALRRVSVLLAALLVPSSLSVANEIVTVGVLGPLTTESKSFGIGHLQGITLKANEINEKLKMEKKGWRIRLQVADDQKFPWHAVAAARLLEAAGVAAIFGPANSDKTTAVVEHMRTQGKNIPIMSSLSTATTLTDRTEDLRYKYFFRANISDRKRMRDLLAHMFEERKDQPQHRKLAILYEGDDEFGEGLLNDAEDWLHKKYPNYLRDNTIKRPFIRNIKIKDAKKLIQDIRKKTGIGENENDAFLLFGLATDAVTLIKAIRDKGLDAYIYFAEFNHLVFKQALAEGLPLRKLHVFSVWWGNKRIGVAAKFQNRFDTAFGEQPSFSAALAYDAAQILFWAIEKAIDHGVDPGDTENFREAVGNNIRGVDIDQSHFVLTGTHKFKDNEYVGLNLTSIGRDEYEKLWPDIMKTNTELRAGNGGAPGSDNDNTFQRPDYYILLLVYLFGYAGSVAREVSHLAREDPHRRIRMVLRKFFMPLSLVVDPFVALIVFGSLLVVSILSFPEMFAVGTDARLIYLYSSVAIGGLSGYLGIKALNALLARLHITHDDHPPAPQPVSQASQPSNQAPRSG